MSIIDTFGRRINYLRMSVTDRCNLRCRYCMPAEGIEKHAHTNTLSYEQLYRIAQAAVAIGVDKIRVTGGEPLVRKGIVDFLARIKIIPGLKKLVLTTNGVLLDKMAGDLYTAGVERLNISLDSLRPDVFAAITRGGDLSRVLAGIAAAEKSGFSNLKINMVVMRGVNDNEILDFAALTVNKPITVRYIEYMPTLKEKNWQSHLMSGDELLSMISRRFRVEKVTHEALDGPAVNYQIQGAAGKLGFITPISSHFCQACNRIRVTSTGAVKSCLFDDGKINLKPYLENGDDVALQGLLRRVASTKPDRHGLVSGEADNHRYNMSQIGG